MSVLRKCCKVCGRIQVTPFRAERRGGELVAVGWCGGCHAFTVTEYRELVAS